MSQLEILEAYKADAMELLAENEHVIASQKEHIEMLEFHLGKMRDSAYQMFYATAGILPTTYAQDGKPEKVKKAKK